MKPVYRYERKLVITLPHVSIVPEIKYNSDKDYKNYFIRTNLSQNSKYWNGIDLLFGI
jgi:hypothetical protein